MINNIKNLRELIDEKYTHLSKGQQKIANLILANPNKLVELTAKELADILKLSESTIVRFAQELGLDGYRDLKNLIIDEVKSSSTSIDRMNIFSETDVYSTSFDSSINSEISYLKRCENFDKELIKEVVSQFNKSRKIYILGCRTSHFLASYFYFYLKILMDNVVLLGDSETTIYEELVNIHKDDMLFVISYPRYTRLMLDVVKHVKDKNVFITSLTDSDANKLSKLSDITLSIKNNLLFFIDSLVVPMAVINSIIIDISLSDRQNTINSLTKMEDLWSEYNIFDIE